MTPAQLAVLADHLRSILPEKDAADVVRWAAHPEAVRELLERAGYEAGESPTDRRRVAAAWRALGDPRGAADIERAHEEALAEENRRGSLANRREALPTQRAEWPAAWARMALGLQRFRIAGVDVTENEYLRALSDSRGMEAVEDEARNAVAIINVGPERETILLVPSGDDYRPLP